MFIRPTNNPITVSLHITGSSQLNHTTTTTRCRLCPDEHKFCRYLVTNCTTTKLLCRLSVTSSKSLTAYSTVFDLRGLTRSFQFFEGSLNAIQNRARGSQRVSQKVHRLPNSDIPKHPPCWPCPFLPPENLQIIRPLLQHTISCLHRQDRANCHSDGLSAPPIHIVSSPFPFPLSCFQAGTPQTDGHNYDTYTARDCAVTFCDSTKNDNIKSNQQVKQRLKMSLATRTKVKL